MKQFLFVLKEGQISFWKYSRGSLSRGTLNGNRWNDFTPSYWDDWSEANQAGDSVDAILLADKPNGFGTLPEWLQGDGDSTHAAVCRSRSSSTSSAKSTSASSGAQTSGRTIETLAKLANDAEFSDKGLVLSQGKTKFTLAQGDAVETYSLTSSLKFNLPKDAPKKDVAKPEPAKPVAKPTPSGIIGDSYNDPEALKLSVGVELKGTIVKIFNAMKRNYVKVEGLKEQVCFKSTDTSKFAVGDNVTLIVTKVDEAMKKVLFALLKN